MMRKRPIGDIVGSLFSDMSNLVRTEAELVQAEVQENLNKAIRNIVMAAAGGLLLIPAAVVLLEGISVFLMRAGIPEDLAYVIVALIFGAVGLFVALGAIKALKKTSLLPKKTIHQFTRDVEVAKNMRQDHERQRAA